MFDLEVFRAILLGIVQGITEFLPVSSDGHLSLVQSILNYWFGVAGEGNTLELILALHVGTLISIIAIYWKDLLKLPQQPWLCGLIILATIPAGVVGLLFKKAFEQAFNSPLLAGVGFIITAAALLIGQWLERSRIRETDLSLWQAWWIGCCQALALLPGVSRSGMTISAGLVAGLDRVAAARFSFLMAIPVIGGATVLMLKDMIELGHAGNSITAMIMGAATSAIVGYFTLTWLLRMVTQRRLHWFAIYCLILGTITIVVSSMNPQASMPEPIAQTR